MTRGGVQPVETQCIPGQESLGGVRRDVADDSDRLSPDLLVVTVQERDWPIAAANKALWAEGIDGDRDGVTQVVRPPVAVSKNRVQAGDLRKDVRVRGCGVQLGGPCSHLVAPERRLGKMVDHDRQARVTPCELWHVAEVTRKDARQLEDHARLLEGGEARPHRGLEYPVRVGLVVDQVPEASQPRLGPELLESASGSVG